MLKLAKISIFMAFSFLLMGCGSGLPACSDKEVTSLVKQIFQKNFKAELLSISGITTKDKADNECMCTAMVKYKSAVDKMVGTESENEIIYFITLADNKEEFMVKVINFEP